jgi:hypothetical protein
MNQKELIRARTINKSKLEPSSWKNINRIEIDLANDKDGYKHEIAKEICFILIKKGVPADSLPFIFKASKPIEYILFERGLEDMIENWATEIYDKNWKVPVIVTEARFKTYFTPTKGKGFLKDAKCVTSNYGRRADLFILDTGEIVEIETDDKIKKENAITVYI